MGSFWRSFLIFFLLLGSGCSVNNHYGNPDSAAVVLPVDPGIVRGELENGFKYWVRSTNASGSNHTIELRLLVGVGSVDEEDRERGYAHLLEHVVFRAAESSTSLDTLIANAGLRWGADVNAYTFPDHTEYRFTFSADQVDLVPQALAFSSAILGDLKIGSEHVEPEKRIVEAEWRKRRGDDPDQQNAYIKQRYAGTRWLERPPLGDLGDLRRATAGSLQNFWQRYYTPANSRLIVTGKIDPVDITTQINRQFSTLPTRQSASRVDASRRPSGASINASSMMDPEASEPRVSVTINRPLQRVTDFASLRDNVEERLAVRVLQRLLSAGVRASNKCTAYATQSFDYPRRWSVVRFRTVPIGNANFQECAALLQTILLSVDPVLEAYGDGIIKRAREDILAGFDALKRQTPRQMVHRLSDTALLQAVPVAPGFAHKQAIEILRITDRKRVLGRIDAILREPRFFSAIAPAAFADDLPPSGELLTALRAAEPGDETLVRSQKSRRQPPGVDGRNATLVAETNSAGVWHWSLSNGVRIYFFRSTEREGVVAAKLLDSGGYADVPKGITSEARYLSHYHSTVAFGDMASSEVRQVVDDLHLYVDTDISATSHSIEGVAASSDLDSLFKIMKSVVGPLASDSRAWKFKDRVRQWQRANQALAEVAVQAVYWKRLVEDTPLSLTNDKKFSITQSGFEFAHRELFQSAREPVVVIYGDASSERIKSLALDTFAGMKPVREWRTDLRFRQQLPVTEDNRVEIEVGNNSGSFRDTADVYWFHHCTNRDREYEQFSTGHGVLAEVVSKRLSDRIREELGLSYGARVGFSLTDKYQQVARYRAEFVTGGKQRDLLLAEVEQVLRQLGRDSISTNEIDQAVKKIEAEQQLLSKYPLRRASQLAQRLLHGATPDMARELSLDAHRSNLDSLVTVLARQCFGSPQNDWLAVTRKAVDQ